MTHDDRVTLRAILNKLSEKEAEFIMQSVQRGILRRVRTYNHDIVEKIANDMDIIL